MVARRSGGPDHAVCLQECWEGQCFPIRSRVTAGVPRNSGRHKRGAAAQMAVAQLSTPFSEEPVTSPYRMETPCGHLHFLQASPSPGASPYPQSSTDLSKGNIFQRHLRAGQAPVAQPQQWRGHGGLSSKLPNLQSRLHPLPECAQGVACHPQTGVTWC